MISKCLRCGRTNRIYAKGLCQSCYIIKNRKQKTKNISFKASQNCVDLNKYG